MDNADENFQTILNAFKLLFECFNTLGQSAILPVRLFYASSPHELVPVSVSSATRGMAPAPLLSSAYEMEMRPRFSSLSNLYLVLTRMSEVVASPPREETARKNSKSES